MPSAPFQARDARKQADVAKRPAPFCGHGAPVGFTHAGSVPHTADAPHPRRHGTWPAGRVVINKTGHPLARAPVRHLVGLSVALVAWTRKDLRYATNERAVSAGVSPGGRPPPENGEHVRPILQIPGPSMRGTAAPECCRVLKHEVAPFANGMSAKLAARSRHVCAFPGRWRGAGLWAAGCLGASEERCSHP